jgi:beta-lactam-binding protein with PASTA domain
VEDEAPAGTVVAQDPPARTRIAEGERVRLNVSTGPGEVAPLPVPDLTGSRAAEARRLAWERGFTTRTVGRGAPSPEQVGEVLLQEPEAGARVPALSQITLYVGR